MKYMDNQKIFSTRDITLAGTLIVLHFKMVGIDYQIEGERGLTVGYFKFDDTPNLKHTEQMFWDRELSVEPRKLIDAIRDLKAQISNVYKSPCRKNH